MLQAEVMVVIKKAGMQKDLYDVQMVIERLITALRKEALLKNIE